MEDYSKLIEINGQQQGSVLIFITMEKVTINEIIDWSGGIPTGETLNTEITGISTDTRTIKPGELFIPLVGENFDGHNFINKALDMGAAFFIYSTDLPTELTAKGGIRVKDTQRAYQDIARGYLRKNRIPVVAITGSNGKTTTKDYTSHILSQKYRVVKTRKNFNNEIGVPKTVLELDSSIEILVVEMAMRGVGQIRELARIVEPDIAVITNVGESHFELLGSYEAIARTKSEILEFIQPGGNAVLNSDDKWYWYMTEKSPEKIKSFGIKRTADVKLLESTNRGLDGYDLKIDVEGETCEFHLPLLGEHNIYNALTSITIARCMNLTTEEIAKGISTLTPSEKRLDLKKSGGGWIIINDSYNASPTSTESALNILGSLPKTGRKIAALGDMLELGAIEVEAHRNIGKTVFNIGLDLLLVKGKLGAHIASGAKDAGMDSGKVMICENSEEIINKLKSMVKEGDTILVKGSRLMKMEEIAEKLL